LMAAGEQYLKDSQFYKAADAYTLAAVYQSDNPLPYAGKSHALFAAGEYMSSAFYLARAIEIWPDYLRFKVDLRKYFDKDLVENRMADISQWQEKTDSPELLMLLGYVYYQTDRLEQAQMAINGAMMKMPESKAIGMLKKVVDAAIKEK
jgi:tetratricopeptide (TPR) repeat protein